MAKKRASAQPVPHKTKVNTSVIILATLLSCVVAVAIWVAFELWAASLDTTDFSNGLMLALFWAFIIGIVLGPGIIAAVWVGIVIRKNNKQKQR